MFWSEMSLGLQKNFSLKEQRTALGTLQWAVKQPRCERKQRVLPFTLSCLLIHFWTGKKYWMISLRSDCRMDEDRKVSKVWFASQWWKFWNLTSLLKNGKYISGLYQEWRMRLGEQTGDKSTLIWGLSLVRQV